jgi:hypothetical protein
MEPAEKVALLALVYREFEAGARAKGTSLLKRLASDQPNELDALIFSLMDKTEELAALMVDVAGFDELRYEALLHAWPPGPNDEPPPEEGFDPERFTAARWHEVEDAMWQIYATGITHSPEYLNVIAEEAYAAGLAQMSKFEG